MSGNNLVHDVKGDEIGTERGNREAVSGMKDKRVMVVTTGCNTDGSFKNIRECIGRLMGMSLTVDIV